MVDFYDRSMNIHIASSSFMKSNGDTCSERIVERIQDFKYLYQTTFNYCVLINCYCYLHRCCVLCIMYYVVCSV
jgi:hypothetical protein